MISLFRVDGTLRRPKLPLMPRLRLSLASPFQASLLLALAVVTGCERSSPGARPDSASVAVSANGGPVAAARDVSGWNHAAGPALLVEGASPEDAIVLLPFTGDTTDETLLDAAAEREGPVTLFGRGGARFSAQLGALPDETDGDCPRWPLRDVRPAEGATAWAIGFVGGRAAPLPLDSVDVLSARDSVALVAETSRLASAVTALTTPAFQGLRFTAHDIRRFDAAPGVRALVAHVIRRVNQEANPQEEQTLLIAERDSGATAGPYHLTYAERTVGREDEVTTPEVLAGARIAGGPPVLVVARDGEQGVTYVMIERVDARRWRVRWSSASTSCS
jgi:hypothetical protein